MNYTRKTISVTEDLHQDRRLIVIDPTLLRAAQLVNIHAMSKTKENENDVKFLVKT